MASQQLRKYYLKGDIMPFEEDTRTEFKGHLNLCREEIPKWALPTKTVKATRRPISRNLNAFLNSGTGGTVYLGVVDNGKILGFTMSYLQRDHFLKALEDLMSRYKPKVLPHQYRVHFTPVFNKSVTLEEIRQRLEKIGKEQMPEMCKDRKHSLRDCNYCWCDKESQALHNVTHCEGQEFVVEVVINPWDPHDDRNFSTGLGKVLKFQPYYSDEESKVYFRRQASVVQYSQSTIAQITKQEVKEKYEAEMERLQQQYLRLEQEKAARTRRTMNCSTPCSPALIQMLHSIGDGFSLLHVREIHNFDHTAQEIARTTAELKPKVNHLRDLEHKEELKGFNLSPLTQQEIASINDLL